MSRRWRSTSFKLLVSTLVSWLVFVIAWPFVSTRRVGGQRVSPWAFGSSASTEGWLLITLLGSIPPAYVVLAILLNTTHIHVDARGLRIAMGPVPWLGGRTLGAFDILQIYCEEHGSTEGSTYSVSAIVRDRDKPIRLLSGLECPDAALFVERKIELTLGIADHPVDGETHLKHLGRRR